LSLLRVGVSFNFVHLDFNFVYFYVLEHSLQIWLHCFDEVLIVLVVMELIVVSRQLFPRVAHCKLITFIILASSQFPCYIVVIVGPSDDPRLNLCLGILPSTCCTIYFALSISFLADWSYCSHALAIFSCVRTPYAISRAQALS